MFTHILVPHDTSDAADHALYHAKQLAKQFGAKVTLVSVISANPATSHAQMIQMHWVYEDQVRSYLLSARDELQREGISADCYVIDHNLVAEAIIEYANSGSIDLVVMGTHGRTGFNRLWLGSVADKVRHQVDKPLLLVQPKNT